jgi:hypothetical protein
MEAEQIEQNWETFCKFVEGGLGERSEQIDNLLESLGERLATCPLSTKAESGTLVDFNIKTLKACSVINNKFELGLSKESMILCCLFRNLGLVGDLENDLFLPEDKWHQDRGMLFKYNSEIQFMKPFDRTIWLLNHFRIKLTQEEFLAFLSGTGTNDNYKFGEVPLAFAVYSAMRFVGLKEEKYSGSVKN